MQFAKLMDKVHLVHVNQDILAALQIVGQSVLLIQNVLVTKHVCEKSAVTLAQEHVAMELNAL
jgi:hypothetical protein